MKSVCVFLWMMLYSLSALASGSESCPGIGDVTLRAGVYTAPANSAGSEWVAVASASPAAQLTSFEMGVFYPENNQPGTVGRIGYCEYKTQDQTRVNLHYGQRTAGEASMRLTQAENWNKVESGLGLVVYECTASTPGACSFAVP